MTFYTEEVKSDSKAFDLCKGAGLNLIWGTGCPICSFFILVHPGIFGT